MDKKPEYNYDSIRRNTPEDLTSIMLALAKQVGVGEYQISEEDRGVSSAVDKALNGGLRSITVTDPVGNGEYRLRINDGENVNPVVADTWNEVLVGISDAVIALTAVLDLRSKAEIKVVE